MIMKSILKWKSNLKMQMMEEIEVKGREILLNIITLYMR